MRELSTLKICVFLKRKLSISWQGRSANKPAHCVYYDNGNCSKVLFTNVNGFYQPLYLILFNLNGDLIGTDNSSPWALDDNVKENYKWLIENEIKLSEENDFEIPDEYKAEFRIRFL